jgi:hypothetical protein
VIAPLDIFMIDKDGSLIWKGTAEGFEMAKLSVLTLMRSSPADYMIYSHKTGHRTIIKIDGSFVGPNVTP